MRIAVFGRPGGGKSMLARRIAREAGLPLVQLDLLRYEAGGAEVPANEFAKRFSEVMNQPSWVLDGFASRATFETAIDRATVLAYVERPTDVPDFLGPLVSGKMALDPRGRADEEEPIH